MNHSKQRDLIMDYLMGTKSHPTAEEVYNEVKLKEPNISLGTVYRNLNLLADNNIIVRLHMKDGIDHFDADTSEHYHFYCNCCSRVYDLDIKAPAAFNKCIASKGDASGHKIEGAMVYFYGTCKGCALKTD